MIRRSYSSGSRWQDDSKSAGYGNGKRTQNWSQKMSPPSNEPALASTKQGPSLVHKIFRSVIWAPISFLLAFYNLYITFGPNIVISPSRDPNFYTLTNSGRLSAYDVVMQCSLWDGHTWHVAAKNWFYLLDYPLQGNPSLPELPPNRPRTLDCRAIAPLPGSDVFALRMTVQVTYSWPFGLLPGSRVVQQFSVRFENGRPEWVADYDPSMIGPPPPKSNDQPPSFEFIGP